MIKKFLVLSLLLTCATAQPMQYLAYLKNPKVLQGIGAAACLAAIPASCFGINKLMGNQKGLNWLKGAIFATASTGSIMLLGKIMDEEGSSNPTASLAKMAAGGALFNSLNDIEHDDYGIGVAMVLPYIIPPALALIIWGLTDIKFLAPK